MTPRVRRGGRRSRGHARLVKALLPVLGVGVAGVPAPVGSGDRAACLSGERRADGDAAPHGSRQAPGGRISQRRRPRPRRAGRNADRPHAAPLDPPAAVTRHDHRRRASAESHPPREAHRETVAWWTDDAAGGGHRCSRSRQGLPAPEGMRRYAAVGSRPNAASTADGSCAAVPTVAPNPGARGGIRTEAIERTNASTRITASRAWRTAVPFHVNPPYTPYSRNRPHLSDEAQDPDGDRGGRAHGPDPPPDAPGCQIRERDPHARRSQEYRLSRRSRRAKPGPGHAGHPDMDLSWRTRRVCGQSAPTRVGAARHRRAAEHPQPPGGTEATTHDRIERPRHTNTAVADADSGRASVPTRRTDVPRGAAPGRTATA